MIMKDFLVKNTKRIHRKLLRPFSREHCTVKQCVLEGRDMLVYADEPIGWAIYCHKTFEKHESAFVASTLEHDSISIDVGANVGFYTLLLASRSPHGEVHAFEPIPKNCHLLNTSAGINGFGNVTVNCCAVGDKDGELSFVVSKDSGFSSFRDTGRCDPLLKMNVAVKRLDSYCAEKAIRRIDFLKVDVEGAELQVLKGARGILSQTETRPKLMMLELYDRMLTIYDTNIYQIMEFLRSYAYEAFVIVNGRILPFVEEHHNRYYNVFFTRDKELARRNIS